MNQELQKFLKEIDRSLPIDQKVNVELIIHTIGCVKVKLDKYDSVTNILRIYDINKNQYFDVIADNILGWGFIPK